ncbi:efflux RND transporter periplasmic adaptor subunit [Marinimicrobium alkaliphilum]|uniref:efflux RND transporter periplasmic adaptor subunit n=1 Tax=Marinimicrobium alkaliphilum TaxID=2202654 RepID=UPI000DBA4543|nr:efflux RND transporter periplasmic adaptor subunit [Marinimicrobium alkaliphilum]
MNQFSFSRVAIRACLPLCALALISACSSEQQTQGQQGMPPAPVTVQTVDRQSLTHRAEYAGRVRGLREVDVRARVPGILQERRYREGDVVEQGQTLFQIEPESYELAVRSAEAERADARAANAQAEREWERVSGLYERDAVSRRERDQAEANREAGKARLARAQSALDDARRNLRYTRVEAPVSGIAGIEGFNEGNLVEPGMHLTTLTQQDRVHLHFALPETDAAIQRAHGDREGARAAQLILSSGEDYPAQGQIDFTDSRIDPATGSVRMRAEFPNPEGDLVPGQFVRVRVTLAVYDDIFLIDPAAVSQGPEGPQVFVVADDTAEARPVRLGPVVDGKQVVHEGLSGGDRLVVNGHVALGNGAPVQVVHTLGEEA